MWKKPCLMQHDTFFQEHKKTYKFQTFEQKCVINNLDLNVLFTDNLCSSLSLYSNNIA